MEQAEMKNQLRQMIDEARFSHTMGVVACARELAGLHGANVTQAELAALLHDCARCLSGRELLAIALAQGLPVDELEREIPDLLHGRVGACFARTKFGINDREVMRAIELHTLGAPEMGLLDKIIFVADMVEPGRQFPGVERLRQLVRQDLDLALLDCFDTTIRYVLEKQQYIHPRSIIARNSVLLKLHKMAGT